MCSVASLSSQLGDFSTLLGASLCNTVWTNSKPVFVVADLLAYDIDSDDDYNTPCKPNNRKDAKANAPASNFDASYGTANKENLVQENAAARSSLFNGDCKETNHGLFPKRPSEMPMLDSDSDDEDSKSNHNLNCAILNDSFILSPSQEVTCSSSVSGVSNKTAVLKKNDSNLSFLGRFGNMAINCNSPENSSKKPPPSTLQTITEQRKAIDSETPMRPAPSTNCSTKSQANFEAQFVTPQVKPLSMVRSTRNQCSTQTQKQRSNLANEFRSQKVLFQTPMTVSRAAPFPSDSLTFSLCDTISESPDAPARPPERNVEASGKSKKSLEGVFSEAAKQAAKTEPEKIAPIAAPIINAAPVSNVASATSSTTKSSNVLTIKSHDYLIIRKLGCGGSSSVYLARHKISGEEFALKVVDLRADPVVVEGYLNETKLLAKLQGNACVVSLYDYQLLRQESKLYMVMEKGDSDLNKILQGYTTNLPLYNLMNILYQMLQAVNYIHQNGVIHSDLKPANFLMVNGRLKLIDFGIASNIAVDSTSIIKFSPAGTFNYISPEALTDVSTGCSPMRNNQPKIKISTKSDVWSLGCILYLLLYQKTPFSHIRNINAKINAISSPNTSIEYPAIPVYYPIMLVHMVKNCLQLDPKKRPSCAELLKYPFNMVIPIQNLQLAVAKR